MADHRDILPLDEGHFSYLQVCGNSVELKLSDKIVWFHLSTAEQICGFLAGHVEDRKRRQSDWVDAVDWMDHEIGESIKR